jgi:hypothetical protein
MARTTLKPPQPESKSITLGRRIVFTRPFPFHSCRTLAQMGPRQRGNDTSKRAHFLQRKLDTLKHVAQVAHHHGAHVRRLEKACFIEFTLKVIEQPLQVLLGGKPLTASNLQPGPSSAGNSSVPMPSVLATGLYHS